MISRNIIVPLLLTLPALVYGERPELSFAEGISGKPQELIIQGSSPGTRLQLFDGILPIGAVVVDRAGAARLSIGSLPSGQHAVRALEWGTGRTVAESFRFTVPAKPADSFSAGASLITGIHPVVVTSGDLDGQGFPSVILADAGGVSLVRNSGGVFSSPVKLLALSEPTAIVVQDFNGDGFNDLAITSADGRVAILLNLGGGQFAPAQYASAGARPSAVASADFNGDGIPDLAIANQDGNDVSILIGKGDGSFRPAAAIPAGYSPRSLVVADFNGDGMPDVATANFAGNNVSVLLGNGKGGFRNGGVFPSGNGPASLVAADFDEDGFPDLAVLNQLDGNVVMMLNDGSGAFPSRRPTPGRLAPLTSTKSGVLFSDASSLGTGDVNGDGHSDFLMRIGNQLSVRTGRGDGSFGNGYSFSAGESQLLVALDDFNRDGRLDAVTIDHDGTLTMLAGTETPQGSKTLASESLLALSHVTPAAATPPFLLTFEGLKDGEQVLGYYNGSTGNNNSGPGPSDGVTFGNAAVASITTAGGGSQLVSGEPSCCTYISITSGSGSVIMNVAGGFANSLSFYYDSNPFGTGGSVSVLNASGATIGSVLLPASLTGCDNTGFFYDCWTAKTVTFSGTAFSVNFAGATDQIAFDNIMIGSPVACSSATLSSVSAAVPQAGGSGAVQVTVLPSNCSWTATSNSSWINVTSTSQIGNGTVTYSVTQPNNSSAVLYGSITIAGVTFQLAQSGATCVIGAFNPSNASLPAGRANYTVTASLTPSDCPLSINSIDTAFLPNWITINSVTGNLINYTVADNTSSNLPRSGSIDVIVAGANASGSQAAFNVTQIGATGSVCNYTLAQTSQAFSSAGGAGSIAVTSPAGCPWSPTVSASSTSWLTITSGSQGTAVGSVGYNVQTNSTATGRNGIITIAGQNFVVTQAAGGAPINCTASLPNGAPPVLAEGRTEILGSLLLTCSGLTTTITADITLALNTNVTNAVTGANISDASLTIPGLSQPLFGQVLSDSTLHWSGVTLSPGNPVTISNVRADASLLAAGTGINGQVVVNSTVPVTVTNANPLATTAISLSFLVGQSYAVQVQGTGTPESFAPKEAATVQPAATSGTLTYLPVSFQELIPSAFHTTSPATRFRIVLSNIPSGAQIYAPVSSQQWQLYSTDCSGQGNTPATGISIAGASGTYFLLPVGVATATYQVVSANPGAIDTLTIPLLWTGASPNWPQVQIVGSYATVSPASTANGFCSSDPASTAVPRYRDFSVPLQFSYLQVNPTITRLPNGTFTILTTVTNVGSQTWTGAVNSNILQSNIAPGNLVTTCQASAGTTCTPSGGQVALTGSLSPGQSLTYTVNGTESKVAQFLTLSVGTASNHTFAAAAPGQGCPPLCPPPPGAVSPQVQLDFPQQTQIVSGNSFKVSGSAAGSGHILGVQVMLDGNPPVTATYGTADTFNRCGQNGWSFPDCSNIGFTYSLDTTRLSQGQHTIQVVANDDLNDTGRYPPSSPVAFTVNNQGPPPPSPPSVNIDTPANGATVPGSVTVAGWALDNVSTVPTALSSVTYILDHGSPASAGYGVSRPDVCNAFPGKPGCPNVGFSFALNGLTPGPHTITVSATDSDTTPDTGSASITINVPGVTVTGRVTVAGTNTGLPGVTINVNGSESTSMTTDPSGNYTFTLPANGTYTLSPARSGYSFSAPVAFSNLSGNQTANFTGMPMAGLEFYPVTPCRVADTRSSEGFTGAFGPPAMTGGTQRSFPISGSCGIPSTAVAYSLNFTVVPQGGLGFLSTWPTGQSIPNVSTLNSITGTVVANAAIVPAGQNGAINVYVSNTTDVFFDVNGYFAPPATSGLEFYPVAPCRVADTRAGQGFSGAFGPPTMAAATQRSFTIPGSCGIPATAAAYSLNFTVVPQGGLSFLTTWPAGQSRPNASTLNSFTGTVVANAAIVPAGLNGAVSVYVSNTTDVFFDVNGYFAPPTASGLQFYPVTPCRIADTRTSQGFAGSFGPPSMPATTQRSFPIPSSSCEIPASAGAYSLNFTVVPPGGLGYLSTFPTGQPIPNVSTLNSFTGTVVANAALVPAGQNGAISVYVSNPTDVFFDVNGYFQ